MSTDQNYSVIMPHMYRTWTNHKHKPARNSHVKHTYIGLVYDLSYTPKMSLIYNESGKPFNACVHDFGVADDVSQLAGVSEKNSPCQVLIYAHQVRNRNSVPSNT